jgi:archaellum component FlaC
MEHEEELIRDHTKKLEQIDRHAEELRKGTKKFEEIDEKTERIENRTKKIRDEVKQLSQQVNDVQNAIGKKDITNGHTAKELDEIRQTNRSVHEKLDGIIEDIGFLKGQKAGSKDFFDRNQKLVTLSIGVCLFIITILEVINVI